MKEHLNEVIKPWLFVGKKKDDTKLRDWLVAAVGESVSDLDLLGWGLPTTILASETQPKEKGRMTSLSILSPISSRRIYCKGWRSVGIGT